MAVTGVSPSQTEPYRGIWLTILLSLLLGFASISTDFYLPAMPSMGESLGANQGMLELTISGYLLGFSFGQLFWGPISDKYGRKLPLLVGIGIFMLGASGCALSTDAWQMIGWRIVQAIGASAAVVLARAMVRDLFDRTEAARILSTLMMIMGVAPMIGPIAGAQILALFSWHAIFWTLALVGLVTFLGVARTEEALPPAKRTSGSPLRAFAHYGVHFRNRRLMAYSGVLGLRGAGTFAYVAGSPFVFMNVFGLSPELYGLVFASGIIGIVATNAINRRLLGRYSSDALLFAGVWIGGLFSVLLLLASIFDFGGIVVFSIAIFVFIASNGIIGANAISGGLSSVEEGAGSASALLGFAQYGGGMVGSALVGLLANGSSVPMALIVALSGVTSTACALLLFIPSRRHSAADKRGT